MRAGCLSTVTVHTADASRVVLFLFLAVSDQLYRIVSRFSTADTCVDTDVTDRNEKIVMLSFQNFRPNALATVMISWAIQYSHCVTSYG